MCIRDRYYGDTVTYRQEDYTVTSVGASEKMVDLDAGTYEITGINAYDEKQEPVTVYYPKSVSYTHLDVYKRQVWGDLFTIRIFKFC